MERAYGNDNLGPVLPERVIWTDADGIEHSHTTSHVYDAAGNRIETIEPLGAVSQFEYDEAGQRTAEIDPLGRRTEYDYDSRGNTRGQRTAMFDARGHRTEYEHKEIATAIASFPPQAPRHAETPWRCP